MKKIHAIAWLVTILTIMIANPVLAVSGVNYEVEVGKTLRLDISDFGIECMANSSSYTWEYIPAYIGDETNYNEFLSITSKSKTYAIIEGKMTSQLLTIKYTGYYYKNGKINEFNDVFYVRVINTGASSTGPATLEVFPTPQTIKVGETKWVYAKQIGAVGGTYFTSENESIATVTRGELASSSSYTTAAQIIGKKAGTVNIVARNVNGLTAICEVTVTSIPVTSVSLPSSLTLEVEDTYTLTPTIFPSNAETTFSWTSDNNNVAIISNTGKVTAKSAGIANIKVTTENGKTATCKVTVKTPMPTEYIVNYQINENGKVIYNGTSLIGNDSFKVSKGCDVTLTISPDEGYKLDSIWVDQKEMKDQLVNNTLTLTNIKKDTYIIVSFKEEKQDNDEPGVNSENTFTLDSVSAYIGTTIHYPISLTNKDEITALQMDMYLPAGITLAQNEDGEVKFEITNRVGTNHTIDCNKMPDGCYRIICYSTKNETFNGNSGELFNVMLNISAGMTDGDYDIIATNIVLSDNSGMAHIGQIVKSKVTILSYMIGDTDNDGRHSINDAVCIINHILNRPNAVFVGATADLDGDDHITINDAVVLIKKYILGQTSILPQSMQVSERRNEVNYMEIEDVIMQPGEERTIEVLMYNERDDIKGIQCDITLPKGVSFLYDDENEDYVSASSRVPKTLVLGSEKQNEQTLRVAGVCTGSSNIYGYSGAIFTFKVKADEKIQTESYTIYLSNIEISYGKTVFIEDCSSKLEVIDNTTGISTVSLFDSENSEIYDLWGKRVKENNTRKGVFIVNGKKILMK